MMTGKLVMMVLLVCAVTLSEQYLFGKRDKRSASNVSTCTEEFQNITGHTMCKPDDSRVEQTGVSASDIATILQIHNANRSHTETPATNLFGLVWNDQIAAVAQKLAQTCPKGHDTTRWVPSLGLTVGQNLAMNYGSWEEAVMGWSSEEADYTYGMNLSNYEDFKKVGHYTQMVQSNAFLIGCGYATCSNAEYSKYYVCNYASAQSNPEKPYLNGTRCSACPSNCENGLCNCDGLVCLNGGTLDPDQCTCQCQKMYKGNNCNQLDCSQYEPNFCSSTQTTVDCNSTFYYVRCPVQCGRCPPKEAFISEKNCTYIGPRYSADECQGFGNSGDDYYICGIPNGWDCSYCSYSNVPKQYCPVMCGLCDKP